MIFSDVVWGTSTSIIILTAFNCVAAWSAVPLTIRMFATIRDKRSLYFRATLISSWGLSLRSSAYLIGYFGISYVPWQFYITLSQIGYVCMVSGFAAVLWSRLGLIYSNERVKKGLKYVMIFNAVTWHPILTIFVMILDAERRRSQPQTDLYQRVRNINEGIEYTQLWFFTCTEILLSCLYIWAAYVYLRDFSQLGSTGTRAKARRAIFLLIIIQSVVIFIDAAVITIDMLGLQQLKRMINSFIYCAKLELEFLVLNQLIEISSMGVPGLPSTQRASAALDFVTAAPAATEPAMHMATTVRVGHRGQDEIEEWGQDANMNFGSDLKDHGLAMAPSTSQSKTDDQLDEVEYHHRKAAP